MPGDAVVLHQRNEILRTKARQRRAAEVRVLRQKVAGSDFAIGEVAAPATGDAYAFSQHFGMVNEQHAAATLSGLRGAHHAGGTSTNDDDIELRLHAGVCGALLGGGAGFGLRHFIDCPDACS